MSPWRWQAVAACLSIGLSAFAGEQSGVDGVPGKIAQNLEPSYTPPTPLPPANPTFLLRELNFSESVLLDKAELDAIAKNYLGRELSLRDLQQIVAEVNALYQRKGMITARALLPPQKIENGSVNIELVEGRLGKVELTGNEYTKDDYILSRVPLKAGAVINGAKLDRDLKWFNRTNDVSLNAGLQPGAAYGESDVLLKADEPPRYVLRVFADNEGVPSTGRNEGGLSLQANGPLGRGDSFNFYGTHSSGADNGSVSYKLPVTRLGGAVAIAYAHNTTAVNAGPLQALGVTALSTTALASYTQPWIANERWLLNTPVAYSRTRSDTKISDVTLSEFDVDKGSVGLAVDLRDPRYRVAFSQTVALLHTQDTFGRNTERTVFNGNASVVFRITENNYGVGRGGWQYSPGGDLPPSDLFQIGGPATVRGYDQGFIAGKEGYYAGIELHRQFTGYLNAFLFFDGGEVRSTGFAPQSIQGTGIGAVASYKKLTLELTAGFALHQIQPDQSDSRLDARIEYSF